MQLKSMLTGLAAALTAGPAFAQEGLEIIGRPTDGAMGFQPAVTDLARDIHWLDGMVNVIIFAITLFVTALLIYCIVRYNRKANPNPASFTHNSPVEIAWTIVPIVILVFIGAFSLPVLFNQQEIPEADVTIKATGYQWYWGYEYVDHEFAFDSYMVGAPYYQIGDEIKSGSNRMTDEVAADLEALGYGREEFLLATDTAIVVPVDKTIVMQLTGGDVIHSWTIPAFGVKQDAVPGRLAELWFKADQEGVYFGQCSELCGLNHAYMPITVKVVSQEAYDAWLEGAIEQYAGKPLSYDVAAK